MSGGICPRCGKTSPDDEPGCMAAPQDRVPLDECPRNRARAERRTVPVNEEEEE